MVVGAGWELVVSVTNSGPELVTETSSGLSGASLSDVKLNSSPLEMESSGTVVA
jgi:hypothetical protein